MRTTERPSPPASTGTGGVTAHGSVTSPFFSRNELFFGLAVLGLANGICERVSGTVAKNGFASALANTFDISVIVWVALAIALTFALRGPMKPASRSDAIVATCAALAFLVPVAPVSWLALTGLAIHVLRTSPRSSLFRRGAWILLAVTVPMFWSRLLFAIFSQTILDGDAMLVGWLVGTPRIGNAIQLADGSGYLWIAPSCSSLSNLSLAILCWAAVSETVDHPASLRDVGWVGLACAAVVAINVTRIGLIGFYPNSFDLIHGPVGATVAGGLILATTLAICLFAVRHELPPRAYSGPTVKIRPGLVAGLSLVLAVSLILKLSRLTHPAAAESLFPGDVANLLERQGFHVRLLTPDDDLPWVVGTSGACQISVTEVAPQGWQQGLLTALARDRHLEYLFDGARYPEQPVIRTRADFHWNRLNRYLGRSVSSRPTFAVISTPACEERPLRELGNLSGG